MRRKSRRNLRKTAKVRKPMPPPSKRHEDRRRRITQADINRAVRETLRRIDMTDSRWDDDHDG